MFVNKTIFQITVQHTEVAVKSIEMQLVRVETCGCAEGYSRDATEIQNIQIADGNICTKLQIPIYMIFPRLFTCPTLISKNFKIGKQNSFGQNYFPNRLKERRVVCEGYLKNFRVFETNFSKNTSQSSLFIKCM